MDKRLESSIGNHIQEIARLSEQIEQFGEQVGLSMKVIYKIHLVLEELLTNAILYGYKDDLDHKINISVQLKDNRVRIDIIDDGAPFNPIKEAPEPNLDGEVEERDIGGLGIHLVKTLVEKVSYGREGICNHLVLELSTSNE